MGTNSCIYAKQRDGEEAILFEGSNPLPFFWLMLLGPDDVQIYCEKIKRAPQEGATRDDTSLGLDKLKAIVRATSRRDYVKHFFPASLSLFDDWIYFLQVSDFSDMKIYVDLYEIGAYYANADHFAESLRKALACIDENKEAWYEDTVAGTCGYEGRNKNKKRFSDISQAYQDKSKKDIYGRFDQRIHLSDSSMSSGKRTMMTILVLIAAGILVAGIVVLLNLIK